MKPTLFKLQLALAIAVIAGFALAAQKTSLKSVLSPLRLFKTPLSESIDSQTLKRRLASKDFTLSNVHTPYEGEIENTDIALSFDQLDKNSSFLPADKAQPLVLYCKTGGMSGQALKSLNGLGYTNVVHLEGGMDAWKKAGNQVIDLSNLESLVLPPDGVDLPLSWGDLGPKLISLGVIDPVKFRKALSLTRQQEEILTRGSKSNIRIDQKNSQFIVDMLWALGLAQKSLVYDEGPMGNQYKKEVGNFSSTGGWTLSKTTALDYYNRFELIPLTPDEQKRVAEIARNIYRPCCGNSTYFPDCNHGMAALAIVELLVKNGESDETIYRKVLAFNSFWFPQSYLSTATYFARAGTPWDKVDAKTVLGPDFSSSQGSNNIVSKVGPLPFQTAFGGSCGA